MIFKPGDRVRLGQLECVLDASPHRSSGSTSLSVRGVDGIHMFWIDENGLFAPHHVAPCVELLSRTKQMQTVTVECWVNIYENAEREYWCGHRSKEEADQGALRSRIACVKLTGTYDSEIP